MALTMALVLVLCAVGCAKAEVESTILTEPTETTEVTEAPTTHPAEEPTTEPEETVSADEGRDYVLNTNSKKFHYPDCSSVGQMKETNRTDFHGSRETVIAMGYEPCGRCKP